MPVNINCTANLEEYAAKFAIGGDVHCLELFLQDRVRAVADYGDRPERFALMIAQKAKHATSNKETRRHLSNAKDLGVLIELCHLIVYEPFTTSTLAYRFSRMYLYINRLEPIPLDPYHTKVKCSFPPYRGTFIYG